MLGINEFEDICKSVYSDNNVSDLDFQNDKDKLIKKLNDKNISFYTKNRELTTFVQFGNSVCRYVNEILKDGCLEENQNIYKLRHEIKNIIAFQLRNDKILDLVNVLNKIPNLETWSPVTLESIARTKTRDKDSVHLEIYDNIFSDEEKSKILTLADWFRDTIRKYDNDNQDIRKGSKVDWDRIIKELYNNGYGELADKFEIINNI